VRYRETKALLEQAQLIAKKTSDVLAGAAADLKTAHHALAELTKPDKSSVEIEQQMQSEKRVLEALGPACDLEALERKIVDAEHKRTAAQASKDTAIKKRDAARLSAKAARTRLETALAPVPEHFRQAARLDHELSAVAEKIRSHHRAHEAATAAEQRARNDLASAAAALKQAQADVTRTEARQAEERQRFEDELKGRNLTPEAFQQACGDVGEIDQIELRIRTFGEQRAAARDRLARATKAIAETDRPDIEALMNQRAQAEKDKDACVQAHAQGMARHQHLEKLRKDLTETAAELDRQENETGALRDLSQTLSGDNDARTTLETFAIATMFDHVLDAANLRLQPMTRGQFRFVRELQGQGRARRGLDILVEDSHTGRSRPTATLSGGETFIAALALALGLSDVVESTRGNIRLDTIFIDEGFGSLDSADDAGTLDRVLQALTDLVGNRRAVGLISHVPLVQQTVPNGFWVKSSPTGSTIEQRW
ncbi:MAG: SbcC/MukB-like Walker B domain-containing protein, partial [Pseudomonadota bacterium]